MSTILKALRQLEEDKSLSSDDSLGTAVDPDPTATPARANRRPARGLAGIGLGVTLAGAGLLLIGIAVQPLFRASRPATVAEQTAPLDAAEVAPEASKRRASVTVVSQPSGSTRDEVPVGVVTAPRAEPGAIPALPPTVAASMVAVPDEPLAARLQPAAATRSQAQQASQGEPLRADAKRQPGTPPIAKPVAAVEVRAPERMAESVETPPVVVASAVPAPSVSTVSKPKSDATAPAVPDESGVAQVGETAPLELVGPPPDVKVIHRPLDPPVLLPVRTIWHPKAERREARLEAISGQAQVVREGDEVDGYTVREISPSAVVFERGGETVRVRVSGR
ncbi:MAG: hypothetical protein VX246_01790 [Myxococcota bacterium]|nr:hypothetical protein [Myxococcota bacterium]